MLLHLHHMQSPQTSRVIMTVLIRLLHPASLGVEGVMRLQGV
jgi:hypothetical protein